MNGTRSYVPGAFDKARYQDRGSPPQVSRTNVYQQTTSSPYHISPSTTPNRFQYSGPSGAYSRKRSRSIHNSALTPSNRHEKNWVKNSNTSERMGTTGDVDSPVPFVNTRYELAGGMDSQEDGYDDSYDMSRREGTRKHGRQDDGYSGTYNLPNLPTDANGRLRSPNGPKTDGVVLNAITRVWDFCTSAFRGFSAGGGPTYPIKSDATVEQVRNTQAQEEQLQAQNLTPVPGRFPDEDFEDRFSRPPSQDRPAKRRQISNDTGGEKWVIVPEAVNQSPQKSPRKSTTGIPRPIPISRGTVARRSILARSAVSHAGSPALHATRPAASFASPRPPTSKLRDSMAPSPASIEARRWAAQKAKEDQEADESIRRFNAKLQAMIREGQEALGTKVEVYDEDDHDMDDEGFVSGESGW